MENNTKASYTITVTGTGNDGKTAVLHARQGEILADVLCRGGYTVPAACGRRGTCGKCAVKLLSGEFQGVSADKTGCIKSCKAVVCADAAIETDFTKGSGLTDFSGGDGIQKGVCGIAVDIGTTTVAACLLKKDGSTVTASRLNVQSAYGADVISRIEACAAGKLGILTSLIRRLVSQLCAQLCAGLEQDDHPTELTVAGNATMLHIFCGISPESMGVYPFKPVFTSSVHMTGKDLGIDIAEVTVLPSVSAFIGGDIVAGIYALGLHKAGDTVILSDLGTNGELVLSRGGKLYGTSTAAGPALEGACMDCGTGGIPGAIDKVYRQDGEIRYTTIKDEPPVGICGAGIVDAVALMLQEGVLDETGMIDGEYYAVSDRVYLSQKDIRQFQLAKSAVYSGIETLTEYAGLTKEDIDRFCIAGGLGYYMQPESAFKAGILPRYGKDTVISVGNTSLLGAVLCIGNSDALQQMEFIAAQCIQVDLGGNPRFNERFMDNMFFTLDG